jgi:hypothetical protein
VLIRAHDVLNHFLLSASLHITGRKPEVLRVNSTEKRAGYVVSHEVWSGIDGEPFPIVTCYTPTGDWIGDERTAKMLCEKMGIAPELSEPVHVVCSIGFCARENKWFGWSHRALFGFGIGDDPLEIYPDPDMKAEGVGKTIETMEEAKAAAIAFAKSVS